MGITRHNNTCALALLGLICLLPCSRSTLAPPTRPTRATAASAPPRAPAPAASAWPQEVSLPYELQSKPEPPHYVAYRTARPPLLDGRADDRSWGAAAWSETLRDIVGPTGPAPLPKGRFKMLWDDDALYFAAELEDPALFANASHVHDRWGAWGCARVPRCRA